MRGNLALGKSVLGQRKGGNLVKKRGKIDRGTTGSNRLKIAKGRGGVGRSKRENPKRKREG